MMTFTTYLTSVFSMFFFHTLKAELKEYQICINRSVPYLTDEQRLYSILMTNYDKNTRPVYNASHPVNVNVGITLTQVFDVDEKNQVLTTNIWLDQDWTDEKFQWDPADYNNLTMLRIPCHHIWKPDIVLYNSAEDYTNGYMQALAMVKHDGNVFWPPIVKFYSTCQIDITFFPFDDQVCKLKMGSWAYDGFQVDVFNRSNGVDLSNYVENGEWDLINAKAVRNVVYYACCPEPFPDVTFTLHLRRRTLYYTYNVIIPCIMLSSLTLLVFWLSPDSGEKVTLGLTVLLAFSVFMLLIAENMPQTSTFIPLIGIYLTCVMSLTSLSVTLAVVVSNISINGRKRNTLPNWLRRLVLALARLLCRRIYFVRSPNPDDPGEVIKGSYRRGRAFYRGGENHQSSDSGCGLIDFENGEPTPHRRCDRMPRRPRTRVHNDYEEILARLQELIAKEDEKEECLETCREWQEASEVIDRFMFWVFLVGTAASTIVILVIMPLTKTTNFDTE